MVLNSNSNDNFYFIMRWILAENHTISIYYFWIHCQKLSHYKTKVGDRIWVLQFI